MNLSKPFIRRPVMTTLVMIPLIVFGIFAYKLLPVSAIPFVEPPIIQVTANYPGAGPEEMGRLVAGPLERQFILMQGIQFVTSSNDYESTTVVLQFHSDVNIDVAAQEVQNAIDKAQGQLPPDLPNPPVYSKFNPSDTPILYCCIFSDVIPPAMLYEYGYSFIGQQMGTIDGVANILTYGFPYAVRVQIDPEAVAAKGISLKDLATTINNENPDLPTGKFYGPNLSMVTKTKGQIFKAKDYEDLIVKYDEGTPVRLKDIGKVYASIQNDKQDFRWVFKEDDKFKEYHMVFLAVFKQQGHNTVKVCKDLEALLDKLSLDLPGAVHFDIPLTQAGYIQDAVDEVEFTLLIAFLLVVIVVFVYLGKIRNSVIPLITLPITITGTFMLMFLFGYTIDIMSMSAITLAIGFLVDDAIVVLENIVRHVEMGDDPYKGALRGSKQIILTVVSISLCLAIVFVPLLFMQGVIGAIFHEFAAVMLIAILFSALISLSLTPMLCSRFVPPHEQDRKTKIEIVSDNINKKLLAVYKPALEWTLHHKKWVVVFCIVNLGISLFLFVKLPKTFLPGDDIGVIQGFFQAQPGTSPEKVGEYLSQVKEVCMEEKEYVKSIALIGANPTDNQGLFFLNLEDASKRPDIWTIIKDLQTKLDEKIYSGRTFTKAFPLINLQVGTSTSGKANYQYILQSFHQDVLYESADKLIAALRQRPELKQVSSDMLGNAPTVDIGILRDRAHSYGSLNATNVEQALMYAYGETYISKISAPENLYYVILEAKNKLSEAPQDLNRLYLINEDGTAGLDDTAQVAIDAVIDPEVRPGPLEINHINTINSVTIAFDVGEGYALSDAIKVVEEESKNLPQSVIRSFAGNTAAFEKTFMQLIVLLILAVFVIYIILGVLYENFIHPLTALSSLPVATLGGLVSLMICGQTLSIYALIGIIMLLGIVMKNGILIIDFALEEMHDNNKSPYDSILSACLIRFRPIIMTTLAAVMGAVPVALGIGGTVAKGRAPLGIVVVGGLIFSQFVTLFVIPAFFMFVCKINEYYTKKYRLFRPRYEEDSKE